MLSNRIYYLIKPFFPLAVRTGLRRALAKRQRQMHQDSWPIDPNAGKVPSGWPGWPGGKRFALILTHDVERTDGYQKCRALMELEMREGFRSSFNLVPQGDYVVAKNLRDELTGAGFEVGVHDLRHDGKLFSSRKEFRANAAEINRHLAEWGAVGFRAGFMLRNLEWLHDLNILYDASTFDTDPFEPQPDGMGTIFPFFVEREGARTYVELPYTLPQDSTLFIYLEEKSIDIWKRKLDWIFERGGMALVNTHPDYMDFNDGPNGARLYPSRFYSDLLRYVKSKYEGQYWLATPKEAAEWYRSMNHRPQQQQAGADLRPPQGLAGKRAAVILFSHFPSDPRPRRAAEALVEARMKVDFFCLKNDPAQPYREMSNGIEVFRIPLARRRDSVLRYFWQYGAFLANSFFFLAKRSFGRKYDVVHVHNMPDVLVFAALIPKLRGAKVILDLHDPMPELMMSIYKLPYEHPFIRLLRLMEKLSIAFADLVLTPNISFRNLFVSRSCPSEKISIMMNSPQEEIFNPACVADDQSAPLQTQKKSFRIMYHGSLVDRHGLDLAVEAVARIRARIPGIELHVYGAKTDYLEKVLAQVETLKLNDCVFYHGQQSQAAIAAQICQCHLGVIPNRFSPFIAINFPTRIFEYLAMSRPVIAPRTTGIQDYFTPNEIIFFEPDNVESLANAMLWSWENPREVEKTVERGREVYRKHLWREEKRHFWKLVQARIEGKSIDHKE